MEFAQVAAFLKNAKRIFLRAMLIRGSESVPIAGQSLYVAIRALLALFLYVKNV